VIYARGAEDEFIVQKDQGYSFLADAPIDSYFRRDNLKLLNDYSGKLMVHRILPEFVNLSNDELPINPGASFTITGLSGTGTAATGAMTVPGTVATNLIGNLTVTLEAANSVGQAAQSVNNNTIVSNTDSPWIQYNQNAYRVNTIEMSNSSNKQIWMVNAVTWQYTQTEDDR